MGFTIMESFMDEVKVESSLGFGTRITMKKTINQDIKNQKKNKIRRRLWKNFSSQNKKKLRREIEKF